MHEPMEHTQGVEGPHVAETGDAGSVTGTVFRKARGLYDVRVGDEMIRCSISNRLRKQLLYPISDPSGELGRAGCARRSCVGLRR